MRDSQSTIFITSIPKKCWFIFHYSSRAKPWTVMSSLNSVRKLTTLFPGYSYSWTHLQWWRNRCSPSLAAICFTYFYCLQICCGQINSPWLGDKVDYGIGLSNRPDSLCVAWRTGTTTLCHSRLYTPSQGLWIGPLLVITFCWEITNDRRNVVLFFGNFFIEDFYCRYKFSFGKNSLNLFTYVGIVNIWI